MTELMPSLCNDCVARNQCGNDDVKMCASYIKEVKIRCDDCKFVEGCVDYGWDGCRKFTPKPSEPMTNEEWLKSKDTADLAEWIYNAMFNKSCQEDVADGAYMQMMTKKDYIESWLMEKHYE